MNMKNAANSVGPGHYDALGADPYKEHRKISFGKTSKSGKGPAVEDPESGVTKTLIEARMRRLQQNKLDIGVPGPKYNIPGDFDFVDPKHPENTEGLKKAKFCFGMNTKQRAKNLDMPGPGEYSVDQYPMN